MAAELPERIDICPWGFWYAAADQAGSVTRTANSAALGGGHLSHSITQTGVGTYREWKVLLAAGTWTLTYVHHREPGAGIWDVSLDGVVVDDNYDAYAAGSTYNSVREVSGVVVATTNVSTLRFEVVSKNASAVNYHLALQWINWKRTA